MRAWVGLIAGLSLVVLYARPGYCQDSTTKARRYQLIPFAGATLTRARPTPGTYETSGGWYQARTDFYQDAVKPGWMVGLTVRPNRKGLLPDLSVSYQAVGLAYRYVHKTTGFPNSLSSQDSQSVVSRMGQLSLMPGLSYWCPQRKGVGVGFGVGASVCMPLKAGYHIYGGPTGRLMLGTRHTALRFGITLPVNLVKDFDEVQKSPALRAVVADLGLAFLL